MIALVGLSVLGLRSAGSLEAMELAAYDWFMRLRPDGSAVEPRILLVTVSEEDIQRQGQWPLPDDVLATVFEVLGRHEPHAIGLDIYRDVPVPPGSARLQKLLASDPRIVGVMKFGKSVGDGVPPPPALRGTDRIGFNDVLVDPGGTVRRGLLFLDDGQTTVYSFGLRLALAHLQAKGITPQPDPRDPRQLRLGQTTIRALDPNEGAYVRADAGGYQFLLDFKAGHSPFASVSLANVLSGSLEPERVKGKIVLIGVTAQSVKDDFYTPHSRGRRGGQQLPGVAIHAHIVSQLVRAGLEGVAPMEPVPPWPQRAWILLWGALGGMLGLRIRSLWWFTLAMTTGLLGLGVLDLLAFVTGWWVPLVPPAMAWVASATIVTAYVSHYETVQRKDLMQLFSRHVSKEVAETLWQQREQFLDGGKPRPQSLIATALFTDLTGFTTVSERLSPEALMDWLNEYMDTMAQRISLHGGVIRQYAGDSIVVVFGVPLPRRTETEIDHDALQAVTCALSMEDALRELNRRWRTEGRPMVGMRIGIFTGPVVAGILGSTARSEYVVVGDTVNTASRLESFDKDLFPPDPMVSPCRILIGETTLARLGGRFDTEYVGDVGLKGKEQRVEVHRVTGRGTIHAESVSQRGRQ
jgi:adenylate cyclase